ncbi:MULTISPECIES: peptide ABC transporter substrate-binding protein [Cyanophyceae]|uniref:peptide ABC transporter substrate-binding protein n=1 Tax=Cyanophyceae TaxID=3028117 RepID=UPI001687BFD6|nr:MULTISPECIES: peptide ABC transporter substrate-binding protein [Cyanophyceae]MBD1915435.1 peptide ABC transporter substrate-binding protein [Phormidium sp. FACHB-77]MBD2028506.1 peptide ABC transporter substrate-binding protein [Phormidium sp. FACHB-322]MBD2051046.1 peptide ABC transporter substrate-binding protein [Leptolyngbya sp. FACHB-60]
MNVRAVAVASLCLLLFGGCRAPESSQTETGSDTATAAADDTLRLLYWQAPTILNPHFSSGFKDAEASRITLEPLASFDADGNMVLFLAAEEPTLDNGGVAADGTSVTWKLKEGITWSDGTPFTAEDVAFTYEFIVNPEVATVNAGTYELVERVEAIDDTTVRITFKEPNPAWYLVFTGTEGMVLPKHIFENYNGPNGREAPANTMPVGTGPYRVTSFTPGDVIVFEANPNYRDADQLAFSRVELKGGGDATSAARAVLQTGDVDYANNLQVEAAILEQLEAAGQGEVVTNFGSLVERVIINFTDPNQATADGETSSTEFPHPFFSDRLVRQAINLALDRDTIAAQIYGPTGQATTNFLVAPGPFASGNTSYDYDPEAAAALLDAAGWVDSNNNGTRDKDGQEMQVVFQSSVNPVRQKTQEIVKQSLEQIGISVELKSIDASVYFSGDPASRETLERFSADLQMFATGNTNPDPGSYMQTYTCDEIAQKANNWSGSNYARYCNPEYDALWQQAAATLDPEERQDLFIQMNDLLIEDAAVMPIVHRADASGVSNRLTGISLTPWDLSTWNIAGWKRP